MPGMMPGGPGGMAGPGGYMGAPGQPEQQMPKRTRGTDEPVISKVGWSRVWQCRGADTAGDLRVEGS
jgi:hypothetical protein